MAPVHDIGLLSTLVISLVAAFAGGLAVRSFGLPPLLGYLLAGIVIGPFTPGFIANQAVAMELADVGVALLLFNIGVHFSFKDLLAARKIAVPGALLQVGLTTLAGAAIAHLVHGASLPTALMIGLSLAIASTAISTRILEEHRQLNSMAGHIALGWLVVQDIIVVIALVLFPLLGAADKGSATQLLTTLGQTILQVTGFVVVMVVGGRRVIPALLGYVARVGSRELFTLAVIVIALGIAYGSSAIFGVSLAMGAFFAGVVIGESDLNHHAAAEALSMQQVFTILFFVSVGMLFDPQSIIRMPWEIVAFWSVIVLGTGLLTFAILVFLRVPLRAAALIGGAFAQIGEFSFVLGELGYKQGFFSPTDRDLVMAVALVSIVINPLIMALTKRFIASASETNFIVKWQNKQGDLEPLPDTKLWDHTILVGHGRVGSLVSEALRETGQPYVVIESDRTLTERLRQEGTRVIYGDAAREAVLNAALPGRAKLLIVAVPDSYYARRIIMLAHKLNPKLQTVVRTHSDEEARYMTRAGVSLAVMGEREIAFGIAAFALYSLEVSQEQVETTLHSLRQRAYAQDQSGA